MEVYALLNYLIYHIVKPYVKCSMDNPPIKTDGLFIKVY